MLIVPDLSSIQFGNPRRIIFPGTHILRICKRNLLQFDGWTVLFVSESQAAVLTEYRWMIIPIMWNCLSCVCLEFSSVTPV